MRTPRPVDSNQPVTFGTFNAAQKIGPEVIALWSRLLKQATGSRLVLKAPVFGHPRTRAAFAKRFAQNGIGAERITMFGRTESLPEHLALYQQIDIALDPFPYNGTTTSCEALWMGVPLVTLQGDAHAGRVGASLLTAVGLPDLIARDADSFVKIGAALASDPARLASLHAKLREQMSRSILCDGPAHAKALESAYRDMWRARCDQGALPGSR